MDPILVLSPHMDDAALSLGQFLASWPDAFVLTVFGGMPDPPAITSYDVNSGFRNSTEAIMARNHEDDRAMHALQARAMRCAFFDNQYRDLDPGAPPISIVQSEIVQAITNAVTGTGATRMYVPVGLAHPDHVLVSDAALIVARQSPKLPTFVYEEIPSRVTQPEVVFDRLAEIRRLGFHARLDNVGIGPLDVKKQAIGCYQSQLWALDPHLLYVPERVWSLS